MSDSSQKAPGIPARRSHPGLLWWVLVVSLGLNIYWVLSPKSDPKPVLATVGSEHLLRADISKTSQNRLAALDDAVYAALKTEAENWIENAILPKEAKARGITVQQLLEQEVSLKAQVSPEDIERRLAYSPAADSLPYPQVLKAVGDDLRNSRTRFAKKAFIESLYPKYRAQLKLDSDTSAKAPAEPTRFPIYISPANDSPSKGPADAPVTIEIYSDFMCPFSGRFFNTMTEAEKQYPGKIRTIFHQFPLPFHEGAHVMAEASLCAHEQGKFWEFHDQLMGQLKGKIEKGGLIQIAQQLGLETASFQTCLESGKKASQVDQNIALGKSIGVTGTPGYRINGRSGFGAVPFETLKPLIEWCLKPQGQYPGIKKQAAAGAPAAPANTLDPGKVYSMPPEWLEKGPSRGPQNAPLTIVEFTDFHCPFCQRGSATMDSLVAKHKDNIRHISKQFPLPMHPEAMKAATAALCAAEQGKYWEFRQELFGASWGKKSSDDLKAAAKKLSLNDSAFAVCLDQDKTKGQVNEDVKTGSELGARGMPTYFINGTPLIGAQPIENFEKAIAAKLEDQKK